MRTEEEMMTLLHTIALDDRIRAVILNGSRANPEVKKDCFQDYDIVYIVKDVTPFKNDHNWIDQFGELLILQMPNSFPLDVTRKKGLTYLMQFCDGNRIDLTLCTKEQFSHRHDIDVILVDKDQVFSSTTRDTSMYHVKKPTEQEFLACCNEFWWINLYVAKGIWRKEVSYAKWYMDVNLREELIRILGWYCASQHNYQISIGKLGKYLHRYLNKDMWNQFCQTYANSDYQEMWHSLTIMNDLFHHCAVEIAQTLQFTYNQREEDNVRHFSKHIQQMKEHATTIF